MTYNSGNSGPRKGFGQRDLYKCPKCGEGTRTYTSLLICSGCGEMISKEDLIKIEYGDS